MLPQLARETVTNQTAADITSYSSIHEATDEKNGIPGSHKGLMHLSAGVVANIDFIVGF